MLNSLVLDVKFLSLFFILCFFFKCQVLSFLLSFLLLVFLSFLSLLPNAPKILVAVFLYFFPDFYQILQNPSFCRAFFPSRFLPKTFHARCLPKPPKTLVSVFLYFLISVKSRNHAKYCSSTFILPWNSERKKM